MTNKAVSYIMTFGLVFTLMTGCSTASSNQNPGNNEGENHSAHSHEQASDHSNHSTTPSTSPSPSNSQAVPANTTESGHDNHTSEHHDDDITVKVLSSLKVKAAEETTFSVRLESEHESFTKAQVTFEYWKDTEQKHEYVDATEGKDGEYSTAVKINTTGNYHLKVHYKKDQVHGHNETTFTVE